MYLFDATLKHQQKQGVFPLKNKYSAITVNIIYGKTYVCILSIKTLLASDFYDYYDNYRIIQ